MEAHVTSSLPDATAELADEAARDTGTPRQFGTSTGLASSQERARVGYQKPTSQEWQGND